MAGAPRDSAPLRVVHVSPSYFPCVGGAERLLQEVSERLVARGHDITVLTFDCASQNDFSSVSGAGLPPDERLNGVRVIRINPGGGLLRRLHEWWLRQRGGWRSTNLLMGEDFEFTFGRPSGFGIVRPLLRLDAELVSSVNWHYGVAHWAGLASRWGGRRHVAVPVFHIERDWSRRPRYTRMLRACAAAIACTEAEAEFMRARGAAAVSVAGGGADPARFEHRDGAGMRVRLGLGNRPVVGFVGRQDELKGVVTLLEAMQSVWRAVPDAVLLLAGTRSHRSQGVSQTLGALSDTERRNVVLVDDFPDRDGPSIMAACDLLAQPSVEEAFGLVLVEAWLCERPVIGADIAATRSLIEPGVDGWLVAPFDSAGLSEKILDLLGNAVRRAEFGRRGRAKVLARYTWERVTDVWETVYRAVARRERGTPPP